MFAVFNVYSIRELSSSSFQKTIHDSNSEAWLVMFGKSSEAQDLLLSLEEKLAKYDIHIGAVDCSQKTNKKLCSGEVLNLYLADGELNPYTKKKFRSPVTFTGKFTLKSVERFISFQFNAFVSHLSSVDALQSTLKNTSSQPIALICSSHHENKIPMALRVVAYKFRHKFNFVHVHNETNLVAEIGSCHLIQVILKNSTTLHYDGEPNSYLEVSEWLLRFEGTSTEKSEDLTPPKVDNDVIRFDELSETVMTESSEKFTYIIVVLWQDASEIQSWNTSTPSKVAEGVLLLFTMQCEGFNQTSGDAASQMCEKLRTDSKPYLVVIPFGPRKEFLRSWRKSIHSTENLDEAKSFALSTIPQYLVEYVPESSVEIFFQKCSDAHKIGVLVMSAKPNPSLMLRNLAVSLQEIAVIGYMPQPSSRFLQNFGSPRLPSVICGSLSKNGIQASVYDVDFFGPIRFASLAKFTFQAYRSEVHQSESDNNEPSSTELQHTHQAVSVELLTKSLWEDGCATSFKGICVMFLLDGSSLILQDRLDAMKQALSSVKGPLSAFRSFWSNSSCHRNFAKSFFVEDADLPIIVAYSPSKLRFSVWKTSFESVAIKDYLNSIISGSVQTNLLADPIIFSSDSCDEYESFDFKEELDNIDAHSLLAEIREEEKRRAQEIKQELDEERKRQELLNMDQVSGAKADTLKKKSKKKKKSKRGEL